MAGEIETAKGRHIRAPLITAWRFDHLSSPVQDRSDEVTLPFKAVITSLLRRLMSSRECFVYLILFSIYYVDS